MSNTNEEVVVQHYGPKVPFSDELHATKYRLPGEPFREAMNRIAAPLSDNEAHFHAFRDATRDMRYLPAGRIQASVGTSKHVTAFNCYVSGTINDSFVDGPGSIMQRAMEAAATMRMGGGIGYDFSTLRPRGALITKLMSQSSGPVSFMEIFDAVCRCTSSSGHRRGAQMGVLRVDHPDIEEFVHAKQNETRLRGFNVSVAATDEFMQAVALDRTFDLRFGGKVYRTIEARALWDSIMRSTWDWAEPGVLFVDTMNRMNNLWYCETIAATNPCVTADTWVMTTDGPQQVKDLVGKRFTAVVNGKPYATVSEGFWHTGYKPVFKVSTTSGYSLRCTADHPIKVKAGDNEQWVTAGDLKPGDRIVLQRHSTDLEWSGAGEYGYREGYLIGALIGDGCFYEDKQAILAVWDKCPGKESRKAEVTRCAAHLPRRSDSLGWVDANESQRFSLASIRDLAFSLGLRKGNKTITPECEAQSSEFYRGILRGLFDCDGCPQGNNVKGASVRLSSISRPMLETVQRMLSRFGIVSTIYFRRAACKKLMPDGHGGMKEYDCAEFFDLVISRESIDVYARRIGFADADKAARLDALLAGRKRPAYHSIFEAEVSSVTPGGEEDVYDVTVDQVHAFDANGITVKNCGEQNLPPFGACLLGSFNLPKYLRRDASGALYFDWQRFEADIPVVVRAMDNVIDVSMYPLPEQEREAKSKRRMGLGITGLANAAECLGMPYGSRAFLDFEAAILHKLNRVAYLASVDLAIEKGPFPLFDAEKYCESAYIKTLDKDVQERIRRYGIRNSHLTSIAPTGTISLCADNVSSSIEPPFAYEFDRTVMEFSGPRVETVQDWAYREHGVKGKRTADVTIAEHLGVLCVAAKHVDSAVSKTCNVDGSVPWDDFKQVYLRAWEGGAKGCTTFRKDGKRGGILIEKPSEEKVSTMDVGGNMAVSVYVDNPVIDGGSCTFDPVTGRRSCE